MSILEYIASGTNAWLVQIIFLLMIGLGVGTLIGNRYGIQRKKMDYEFQRSENTDERRMKELVIEGSKPEPSNAVAIIDGKVNRAKRSGAPRN